MLKREDLKNLEVTYLSRGKFANADVLKVKLPNEKYVAVKDFSKCPFLIRFFYGRWMVRRECDFLQRLANVDGVPKNVYRLDKYAFVMDLIDGEVLNFYQGSNLLKEDFFLKLERLMLNINANNIVHLDSRNGKNVIVTKDLNPVIIDFQSGLYVRFFPRFIKRILFMTDISGVYKFWFKMSPETLDEKRREKLKKQFKYRDMWKFKGYRIWETERKIRKYEKKLLNKNK